MNLQQDFKAALREAYQVRREQGLTVSRALHDAVDEVWSALIKPLAILDPEDEDAAFRLINLYFSGGADRGNARCLQRALREYVAPMVPTPPKPEEPTGLGAVVACENGVKVIRTDDPEFPWVDAARPGDNSYHWTQCGGLPESPVKVLSEGIPA